jgi:hypothetical protein
LTTATFYGAGISGWRQSLNLFQMGYKCAMTGMLWQWEGRELHAFYELGHCECLLIQWSAMLCRLPVVLVNSFDPLKVRASSSRLSIIVGVSWPAAVGF